MSGELAKASRQAVAESEGEPLAAHRLFDVDSFEAMEDMLQPVNGARVLTAERPDGPIRVMANHVHLPQGELWYSHSNARVAIRYPDDGMLRLRLWHGGTGAVCKGRSSRLVTRNRAVISTAGADVEFAPGFEQICWRAPKERIAQKLAAITGQGAAAFDIETTIDLETPAAATMQQILGSMVGALDGVDIVTAHLFLAELEQAFITSFLAAGTHDGRSLFSAAVPRVAPGQVRRVEAYIEANWAKAITIEDLVEVSGASARSLHRTFKESRGCSPLEFARQLRLQHARRMLEHPNQETTVGGVAYGCGFGDLGRFAKDFHRAFGERPSELLARRRDIFTVT